MTCKLIKIYDKNVWNSFVKENELEFYSFLSSWEWGEFQETFTKKIFRFAIFDKDQQIWQLMLIKNQAKRWTYLFAPHNPLIKKWIDFFEVLKSIEQDLKRIAKEEKADFIRFNSPIQNKKENKEKFKKLWFINAPMHEHAEDTHLLNLEISEDELLSNMKKSDRYYINRAIKEWVKIKKWNTKEHIKILADMHEEHSKKVWYHAFSHEFIEKLYKIFWEQITTISASYNNKVESILMTINYWETTVYYIAASDIVSHKFSPNYLCQWEAIKDAKSRNSKIYNFWGVSPDDNPKHPIAWVSKFKRKFAWYDYSLLHAQDLPITWKYWFNYIIETLRRKKRGYYYKNPE